jgi:hypothetical protein
MTSDLDDVKNDGGVTGVCCYGLVACLFLAQRVHPCMYRLRDCWMGMGMEAGIPLKEQADNDGSVKATKKVCKGPATGGRSGDTRAVSAAGGIITACALPAIGRDVTLNRFTADLHPSDLLFGGEHMQSLR